MTAIKSNESRMRVVLSRILSVAAVLCLYRTSDAVAFGLFALGILIYYVPTAAVGPCVLPRWVRMMWIGAVLIVGGVFLTTNIEPPSGSIVPPVLGYGLLLLLAVQILWDIVRNRLLLATNAELMPITEQAGGDQTS